jgi:hypothetical protein
MKTLSRISLIIILAAVILLALPGKALASDSTCANVQVGASCTLRSGQTLSGGLIIIGGSAILEDNSTVDGNVFLTGGSLEAAGKINGTIASTGGSVHLLSTAEVNGDIAYVGGKFTQEPGAEVNGQITAGSSGNIDIPKITIPGDSDLIWQRWHDAFSPIRNFIWGSFKMFALAVLALITALLLPKPIERLADTINDRFGLSIGMGLLSAILAPVAILLLTITLILSPLAVLGIAILVIAIILGWFGLGLFIGKRIAALFKTTWPTAVSTGVGTLILGLVTAILTVSWLGCIGIPLTIFLAMVGLGTVTVTRFGTRLPAPPMPPAPAYPPAPPAPPLQPATPVMPVQPPAATPVPTPPAPAVSTPKRGKTSMIDESALKKIPGTKPEPATELSGTVVKGKKKPQTDEKLPPSG